jgi:small subunit ribosomal protein S6
MKNQTPKLYEGMYILSAQLSEDAKARAFEKIKAGITEKQGKILKVHDQGKRKLAYAIGPHNEGHYYLMYFEATPSTMEELWKEYRLNEDLIRFMTLRTDQVLEKLEFKQLVTEQ